MISAFAGRLSSDRIVSFSMAMSATRSMPWAGSMTWAPFRTTTLDGTDMRNSSIIPADSYPGHVACDNGAILNLLHARCDLIATPIAPYAATDRMGLGTHAAAPTFRLAAPIGFRSLGQSQDVNIFRQCDRRTHL